MRESQRVSVSTVFADMGKAIAAYKKSLRHDASRLNRYVEGVVAGNAAALDVLQPHEVNWLRLFIGKAQCVSCTTAPC